MKDITMKPVMVVNESVFDAMDECKDLLNVIYGNGFSINGLDNPVIAKEIEVNLTLLLNKVTRNELETIIYSGDILMRTISRLTKYSMANNAVIDDFILRFRGVKKIYNKVIGIINERLNKNGKSEVNERVMLDLKNRHSSLTSDNIIKLSDFSIIKIDTKVFGVLENTVALDSKFNYAYGMYLNTNSIASSINLNNTKIRISDSLLPYIRSYA